VQARKLYQYAQERKESEREARRLRELEEKRAESGSVLIDNPSHVSLPPPPPQSLAEPEPVLVKEEPAKPDELTEKLKKLKMLFDNSLISQEEYNQKKLELLSDL
ncbi:MAG: hypothetical protein EOP47_27045, partial [Sphingobacteriaceae bacterium]